MPSSLSSCRDRALSDSESVWKLLQLFVATSRSSSDPAFPFTCTSLLLYRQRTLMQHQSRSQPQTLQIEIYSKKFLKLNKIIQGRANYKWFYCATLFINPYFDLQTSALFSTHFQMLFYIRLIITSIRLNFLKNF